MKNIQASAVRVNQLDVNGSNSKEIYIASIKVRDLIDDSIFRIDYWDPAKRDSEDQGYQRHPHPSHYKAIGKYAQEANSLFPNAILVSCRDNSSKVTFKESEKNAGIVELQNPPFWIIDGQHRVKGLKYTIEEAKDEKWLNREIPVVILAHFSKLEEVAQFNTLNSTAKRVSTDLAQQLMLMRAKKDTEYRKTLKLRGEDWKTRALALIDKLHETEDNPWAGRIKYPNAPKTPRQIVGQNSFLVSLKPMYTNGYFELTRDLDHEYKVVANYWNALREVFPYSFLTPDESVILKTPGIFSLHTLLRAIMQRRAGSKEALSTESFKKLLEKVFADKHRYGDNFWMSDNSEGASLYGSMKGFRILADEFIENLETALRDE